MRSPEAPADLISLFVLPLNRLGIMYMITGAVAAGAYGQPRLTNDIDIVLSFRQSDSIRLHDAFPAESFYVPPLETIDAERVRARHEHFHFIHHETAYKADVYVAGDDPLHGWALERRNGVHVSGKLIWLAPAEYVIIRKLQFFRDGGSSKHVDDIRAMLATLATRVDRGAIELWAERLGVAKEWMELT